MGLSLNLAVDSQILLVLKADQNHGGSIFRLLMGVGLILSQHDFEVI